MTNHPNRGRKSVLVGNVEMDIDTMWSNGHKYYTVGGVNLAAEDCRRRRFSKRQDAVKFLEQAAELGSVQGL